MGTKKIETKPTMKTWIWLKGIKSKALQDLKSEYGIDRVKSLCGKWLETEIRDADGFHLADKETVVFHGEVAHARESIVFPADVPVKIARIDRTKAPKAKSTKHVWEPRTLEIKDSVPKTTLRALIMESVDEINQLGAENAKLKNQIYVLKNGSHK